MQSHSHSHAHSHAPADYSREFMIGIGLNTAFVITEVVYGLSANSMTRVLRKTFKDGFSSSPSAQTKLTADELRRSVSDYRRVFLDPARHTIASLLTPMMESHPIRTSYDLSPLRTEE